ncbi:hypothetical protein NAT51_02985 [Flavobacterium amniphilum]|uniref:hypothetical protein n=1 Tax=Flavobacterium amniphilum TaxID=1834035 RepID=UPI002029CF91|nr:hypothetical protein [Flavobacterium amniphilum]MCL9804470.1 hypothetical protein [Flavobacterium amniphilum]
MSFIKCYEYLKKSNGKRLFEFDNEDIIRAEKMLKMELRLQNDAFNTNDVTLLIERLRNKSAIIQFLDAHEDFYGIAVGKMDYLKNYPEPDYNIYDFAELYRDTDLLLSDALNHFVAEKIKENEFFQFNAILKFRTVLPRSVRDSMLNRVDGKLNQFYNGINEGSIQGNTPEFDALVDLVIDLGDLELNKKVGQIREKQWEIMNVTIDHISKPGIVFFFETMFKGFFYLFDHPTDPKEIRERNRVLKDFKFMGTLLGCIIAVILIFIFLVNDGKTNSTEKMNSTVVERMNETINGKMNTKLNESSSFYRSLYQPVQKEIKFTEEFKDTLQTGYNFFSGQYETPKTDNIIRIENKTGYDMVVFFDVDFFLLYSKQGMKTEAPFAYYIKRYSSFTMDKRFLTHFYFGKELSRVSTAPDLYPQFPRFKVPHANSATTVPLHFEFKPMKLVFSETAKGIQIKSADKFFMDGLSFTEYIFM